MKRQIIVTIDCEDERCGECIFFLSHLGRCEVWNIREKGKRADDCLSAESWFLALVEV